MAQDARDWTADLWHWGELCGTCAGAKTIWCPDCCGFAGCSTCYFSYLVPCPACSGGSLDPIRW